MTSTIPRRSGMVKDWAAPGRGRLVARKTTAANVQLTTHDDCMVRYCHTAVRHVNGQSHRPRRSFASAFSPQSLAVFSLACFLLTLSPSGAVMEKSHRSLSPLASSSVLSRKAPWYVL